MLYGNLTPIQAVFQLNKLLIFNFFYINILKYRAYKIINFFVPILLHCPNNLVFQKWYTHFKISFGGDVF